MTNKRATLAKRSLVYVLVTSMVAQPAFAGLTDISNVPLVSASGASVLPNLLYTLDDSGSMGWDYLPDYVNDSNTCMTKSDGTTACQRGDPPFETGGVLGFNGVGYDANTFYQPGLNSDGTFKLNPPLSLTSLTPNAYLGGTAINLTTGVTDRTFCNSAGTCKRNGQDTSGNLLSGADASGNTLAAGQFPYRTHASNSSTLIFGLPEMMSLGSFARSGSTVTVTTVEAHGLITSDTVFVNTGNTNLNVTCTAVTVVTTNTFTYTTGGSGTINATNGPYRKCVNLTSAFTQSGTTVTVVSAAHGLVTGDVVTSTTGTSSVNGTNRTVTVVDANTFQYTSTTSGTVGTAIAGSWVRSGLYNQASNASGPPPVYRITPVEYCSDAALTTCTLATTPGTAPAGFPFPAYVRFCKSQADAVAPGLVTGASGSPTATSRCQAKYVNSGGLVYTFPRYGRFARENIVSGVSSYGNRPDRSDCVAAPTCTYNEEIQNYARWYTYYRTRMQMMKTATGRAFVTFVGNPSASPSKPNTIRVGFITIHAQDSGSIAASKYLRIADFDTTQASTFFSKLYAIVPGSGTPLQEALSRAGWIFSGKLGSGLTTGLVAADDPMQASCQRNYSILTTDGYWNGNLGQDLGGANVGNMDGVNPTTIAPYPQLMVDRTTTGTFDGSSGVTSTSTTPIDTLTQAICQGGNSVLGGVNNCGCASGQHRVKQRTNTQNHVVVTVNGVVQSDTTSNAGSSYQDITACVPGDTVTTTSTDTIIEDQLGRRNQNSNRVTFSDGDRESISCSSSKPNIVVRQTKTVVHTVETTDGVNTADTVSTTSVTYAWSKDNVTFTPFTSGTTVGSSGANCATSSLAITLSPNPNTTAGVPVTTSSTGTPVAITLSPNPQVQAPGATTTTASGGISDTLADVAMYYYQTDLRGGVDVHGNATGPSRNLAGTGTIDVSGNNIPVKSGAKDFATHQHMTTFTLGLADGFMNYVPDYDKITTGDFAAIKNGTTGACFWNGAGACNWPAPAADAPSALDDLWHAAVNGRGIFYQALNANALATGLSASLSALNTDVAAAAAAATSSPNVTQQDNQIFSTTYETNTWSGQIIARTIDPQSGAINPTVQWRADQQLLTKVTPTTDTRSIWTFDDAATTKLKAFTWANMISTQEQGWFQGKCTVLSTMQQCTPLQSQPALFAIANDGSQLLGFLRGQTGNEATVFRDRIVIDPLTNATNQTVLGDTVSAKPAFARVPTFNYTDSVTPTYSVFKTANASRAPRVFVGANDGYLHAFDATTGDESWAYAPRFLLPGMYQLADTGYASRHRFFVDGSPEVGDVFDTGAAAWKTILVGGAGGGGRGFFALDVTDPVNPKGLWEFCSDSTLCANNDIDLGLSFGNPIIGKRASDGRWVVILTSGLNNTTPGSGVGYFFVLDAITGAVLSKVSTGVGTGTTPSGLMKASAFFDSAITDATFRYVYAGDQLGNVWRLDVSTATPTVLHIATLTDASTPARAQPITTRPSLTHIGTSRVLYIGTGRYLGNSDLSDPGAASGIAYQQTLYGFKDKDVDYGPSLRAGANLVRQTFTSVTPTERGISSNPVDWTVRDGWYVDFSPPPPVDPSPGELVNIDPKLVLGTLVVITNIPTTSPDACTSGGTSKFYNFDFKTGSAVLSSPGGVVGWSSGTIIVGGSIVQTSDGSIKDELTDRHGDITPSGVQQNNAAAGVKRFSYRIR